MLIVSIDTETGGLDASVNALLSIAAVDSNGREFYVQVRARQGLVCDDIALKINGLNPAEGIDECSAIEALTSWLPKEAYILLGSNPSFDLAFLKAASERTTGALKLPYKAVDIGSVALAAHCMGKLDLPMKHDVPQWGLEKVASALGLTYDAHNALADARMALCAFIHLVQG